MREQEMRNAHYYNAYSDLLKVSKDTLDINLYFANIFTF